MKSFPGTTNIKNSRKVTLLWVVICYVSLIAAFVVGISGNTTGISLCYVAAISAIVAFAHTWRRIRSFLILLGASAVGFFVFVLLHNVFYGLGVMASDIIILHGLLEFLHAACFLVALFVCPAGLLIGIVGSIATTVMYYKK